MKKGTFTKKKNKIINQTKTNMEVLGTFKNEFEVSIIRYAEMRLQYDTLNEHWYHGGCVITEEYTNKSGSTNERKTALYMAIETLRKELLEMENLFGLTPKGLKQIQTQGLKQNKQSALDKALSNGL